MSQPDERQRRRTTQSATIRDVAARAGVSPMTVSRVINRESTVKEETRALVEQAITDLNYAPNPAARSLAGSAPFRIGLLYDNPSTGYLSEFLVGALDESSRTGAQIVIEKCAEPELAGATLARLLKTGVDGLILPPPLCESPQVLAEVKAAGAAAVAVAPGMTSTDMATIRIDNEAAAFELTQHLLSLGHKRFGFIKGHPNQTVSQQRLDGFMTALKAAGHPDGGHPRRAGILHLPLGPGRRRDACWPASRARPRSSPATTTWPPPPRAWPIAWAWTCRATSRSSASTTPRSPTTSGRP
jgi:LacI family transcriptional regulator